MNSLIGEIARAGFGFGLTAKPEYNLLDKVLGFLALVRPVFLILTPLNAGSAAVLGLADYPSWSQCFFGSLAVAFTIAAVHAFNDYIDRERDKYIWQTRPIPSGRVKPKGALALAVVLFAASLSIAWVVFNPQTFLILLLAVISSCLYSAYLRDTVGYLSLPPINGLIYLGGWAAFSPETLFSSLLPWYLYLLGVAWQAGHIMIYYPQHILDKEKPGIKVPPAFFFMPSPRVAVGIGIGFIFLTLLMSALLPLLVPLGVLYPILILTVGIYALVNAIRLFNDASNRGKGLKAFTSVTIFRLIISFSILLSVYIYYN
ncbi:UbiA prenyltransferase family protein [Chloroflexota bacterium]